MEEYIEVAIEEATYEFDKLYTYRVPLSQTQPVLTGAVVLVPFGRGQAKPRIGIVLKCVKPPQNVKRIKDVLSIAPAQEALSEEALAMVRYLKQATFCTWYEAVKTVVPRGGRYQAVRDDTGAWVLKTEMQRPSETVYMLAEDFVEQGNKWTVKQQCVLSFLGDAAKEKQEICDACSVGASVAEGLVKRGVLQKFQRDKNNVPIQASPVSIERLPVLSELQQQVLDELCAKQTAQDTRPALLYGITGSGKTAVFLHLAYRCLSEGKSSLILVPEIGLTQQMIEKFKVVFGDRVAVQHSGLSASERYIQWKSVQTGEAAVVIGTRSAVFAPLSRIGLIVLDEEQDRSYQSDASPRYDSIEVAKRRALRHGSLLVLASATPSVVDYYVAEQGRYSKHSLLQRYGDLPLPSVEMADMRNEMNEGNTGAIGGQLAASITEMLEKERQVILLLNKRGYHRVGVCRICGAVLKCDACSVPMIFHRGKSHSSKSAECENSSACTSAPELSNKEIASDALSLWKMMAKKTNALERFEQNEDNNVGFGKLLCHYCGKTLCPAPVVCPECEGEIRYTGFGTQRVEEELQLRFPAARVLRMDLDTTRRKGAHESMLRAFRAGEYDILLGTQMVAKGLDFEKVGLVGVVGIDSLLFGQGYRTQEHVFSLVTQVVGRAGRFGESGHAMIQTMDPENAVLQLAASQNYPAFYEQEIMFRQVALYPPFCHVCVVGFVSKDEILVEQGACAFANILTKEAKVGAPVPLRVLGPAPMNINRVAGQWRWRLTIKCKVDANFRDLLARTLDGYNKSKHAKKTNVYIDFNADTVY